MAYVLLNIEPCSMLKMLNMRMFSVDMKERNVILFQLSVNIICISSSLALLFTDASFTSER